MTNPNPNRRGGFPFPNPDKGRGEPSSNEYQMKIEIPSFCGNLDIESFLDWVYEVEFFDIAYVTEKSMSSSWRTSSKEKEPHDGTSYKSQGDGKAPVITWRRREQLLQGRFLSSNYQQILYNQFK